MIYLTYNDAPSGVYTSQVSDVCTFLNREFNAGIRLVAFISPRNFFAERKKIKSGFPAAWVLPALPRASMWKFSAVVFSLICLITGERKVIARNIIATHLALIARRAGLVKTICLDGRGAIAAEWHEYQVVADQSMKNAIEKQEREAVNESDFRIAVSAKLVEHWRDQYGYRSGNHVVIPCTLSLGFKPQPLTESELTALRKDQGYTPEDVVLVYSGSTAGWQSFQMLSEVLGRVLNLNKHYKLLFLSAEDDHIREMKKQFPGQVDCKWVSHNQVQKVLTACDYGILVREDSVTNRVAAPTKFAEYLSSGLSVIISEGLGDYSDFVRQHQCGMVLGTQKDLKIDRPGYAGKMDCIQLACDYFTKEANKNNYGKLITFMKNN